MRDKYNFINAKYVKPINLCSQVQFKRHCLLLDALSPTLYQIITNSNDG